MKRSHAIEADISQLAVGYANLAMDLASGNHQDAISILSDQIKVIEERTYRDAQEQKFLYDQDRETRDIVSYSLIALVMAVERTDGFQTQKAKIQENS